MTPDPGFIVRIFAEDAGVTQFRGTGILVAPRYVLTCAHTVLAIDPESFDGPNDDNNERAIKKPTVAFGASASPTARRKGTLVAYDIPDMALIRLSHPWTESSPVQFASGMKSGIDSIFFQLPASVIGFSMGSAEKLDCPVHGLLSSTSVLGRQEWLTAQIARGLPPGMSGSPLLVMLNNAWTCLGMAYLGRSGSPTASLIMADSLLSFLSRYDVPCAPALNAARYFNETLGRAITTQRTKRHLSRRQFATELEISEETLSQWEADTNSPAGPYAR